MADKKGVESRVAEKAGEAFGLDPAEVGDNSGGGSSTSRKVHSEDGEIIKPVLAANKSPLLSVDASLFVPDKSPVPSTSRGSLSTDSPSGGIFGFFRKLHSRSRTPSSVRIDFCVD